MKATAMFPISNPAVKPNSLIECTTIEELSLFLEFASYEALAEFIYPNTNKLYKHFHIDKKNSEKRSINAPTKKLKKTHKIIKNELETIYFPRKSAHGFIKGRSIITNARPHTNKKYVFNIDLTNFFGSIHFVRVRNLFQSYPLKLPMPLATVLAQLCCHKDSLPQGSPASPIISNMITYKLDKELQQLAHKHRCTYTRYVDDITFSFSQSRGRLPKEILSVTKDKQLFIGKVLSKIIKDNGFDINPDKSRVNSRDQKQEVTGLIVNDKVNLPRSFIRKTSSILYAWEKFGLQKTEEQYLKEFHKKTILPKHYKRINENNGEFFRRIVKGKINLIKMVRGQDDHIYRRLAYKFTCLIGKPNKELLKSPLDKLSDSTFIIENCIDNAQGTGFLLEKIGLITNEHVISLIDDSNADTLEIFRHHEEDKDRKVNFIKSCKSRDIGILKPTTDFNGLYRLKIGDDSNLTTGQAITVLGYPQYSSGDSPYINKGKIIQSKRLYGQKVWLIDIPIIHGNSGGPVLNEKLEVIGIASIGTSSHNQTTKFHGFIPISTLTSYHKEK
ncbi:MAG: RNA-directed DNA polymerase [Colwellia sp.]|jgi:RNA-directed DNA polymerase